MVALSLFWSYKTFSIKNIYFRIMTLNYKTISKCTVLCGIGCWSDCCCCFGCLSACFCVRCCCGCWRGCRCCCFCGYMLNWLPIVVAGYLSNIWHMQGGLNHLLQRINFSILGHGMWFLKNCISLLWYEEILVIGQNLFSFLHSFMENISDLTFYSIMNI